VKLLAEPGTLKIIGGQIHGGEGVKERSDFLAFAAKRGATLEDLAWMENIYSPPIGALFEPIAIAAQNCLAELGAGGGTPQPQAPATPPAPAVPA
jgi:NADH oxidase (H2O2-forming)